MGRHLDSQGHGRRTGLERRGRDSVQDTQLRSRAGPLGDEPVARHPSQTGATPLGVAASALRLRADERRGQPRGHARSGAGHRARRRAGEHQSLCERPDRRRRTRVYALGPEPRCLLPLHADLDRRCHRQHRLRRHRGRYAPGQPHPISALLSRAARFLPAGRRRLRLREPDRRRERAALLLTSHRAQHRRRGRRPDRRRRSSPGASAP